MADNNYESHVQINGLVIADRVIAPESPTQYNDILKFSNCVNTLVERLHVEGGSEDCIDAVRGRDYTIRTCTLNPHGKNGITLKGGIDQATIQDIVFQSHGSECDIELGQYDMYQEFPFKKTRHVNIVQCSSTDGLPVKVKVWMADKPNVVSGNIKVIKINPVIVWAYFIFRRIQIKLGFK